MSGLPTLDPEIADLGLAIGLLTPGATGVELDSGWFDDPGSRLTATLADDDRRNALVRFADTVMADGDHDERDGVARVHLFDLRALAEDDTLPNVLVMASLDARASDWVEVGLVASVATTDPVTATEVMVPLYRAAKTGKSVAQPFALLAGGVIQLSTDITVDATPAAVDEFGLAGVSAAVSVALVGGPPPEFQLTLKGLHLPGATTTGDITIGGPGQPIEEALLSLVLGLVRQGAQALAGPAAREVGAVLDLVGLGDAAAIPALPVEDLLDQGVEALRTWLVTVLGTQAAREAWLEALGELLGGHLATGLPPTESRLDFPLGAGPVSASVGLVAVAGPGGHLQVTPRVALTLNTDVAGAVRLGVEASVDLLTIDVGTGALHAVPRADVVVTATGSGIGDAADLLHTGAINVETMRLGLSVRDGTPQALVELIEVDIHGHVEHLLDLSSPNAAMASAGKLAENLVATALDALGDAGTALKGLLGLDPPAGVTALDPAHLLSDPLGTVAAWWHDLVTLHPTAVPEVLGHLRDLVAGPTQRPQAVSGLGTVDSPWSIPFIDKVALTTWLDGGRLFVAPVVSLRVDDLAGGCTVVLTSLRVQLASLDLAAGHAQFLGGVDLTTRLRARGGTEARLSLGPVAVVADFVGVQAAWSPSAGFGVEFLVPNLAVDTGTERVPLVLPTVDAQGHLSVAPQAWSSVEQLIGVLAAVGPRGWLADLVDLTGWSLDSRGARLSLAALATDPVPALKDWLVALISDGDLAGTLTSTLAHLTGGTADGLTGAFAGSGTRDDPWVASLGTSLALPGLAVWMGPEGPVRAASQSGGAITTWRPGFPGLGPDGLAQALADEAAAGPDVAALAAGRSGIAAGLASLVGRWVGTDGLVAPPPAPVTGLTTVIRPDVVAAQLAALDPAVLIPGGVPAGSVVVRIAVASTDHLPWSPAADRLIDLTPSGLAPSSFTVTVPAAGEWVIALAARADAGLGATDPSGVLGQAARLQAVLGPLATAGPVVLVALGGAGHAARLAADAIPGVSHLVTLGTPWSPVTFDTMRTGTSADAVRLLSALLPPEDVTEPDDDDLARGRALVTSAMDAVRATPQVSDLEAPRPTTGVRAGLTAIAVFGVSEAASVARAVTAIVAAGLAGRARDRLAAALHLPDTTYVGLRLPFAFLTPPGGHGTTLSGSLTLTLATASVAGPSIAATPSVRLELEVADSDGWLLGGPGTTPLGGALPVELRRLSATIEVGLHGGPATATIVLHEGSALGAGWADLVVASPAGMTGEIETSPLLPEARALLVALTARLGTAVADSPAGILMDLLRAAGVSQADGALVPDALDHLLHDPAGHFRALVAAPPARAAVLHALAGLADGLTTSGDALHAAVGPLTLDADVGTGSISLTATGDEGLLHWQGHAAYTAGGAPTFSVTLGDPAQDAFALALESGPVRAELVRSGGASPVALWPSLDVDGLGRLATAAVPAEALRAALEGLRAIDNQVGTALEDLTSALGMLGPADTDGLRRVRAPVGLFSDPAGWFRSAGVLSVVEGGPFDVDRLVDLLEGIKPFVGLGDTPRGVWPITPGVQISVAPASLGPTVTLDVDATTWIAGAVGRAAVAGGVSLGLTLPATGPPRPAVEVFLGVPDGPAGTSTPQHRSAAHLQVEAAGVRLLLRPAQGSDVEIYPNASGLGSLLSTGVTLILPPVLDELASMGGDAVRTEIAELVTQVGQGLGLASTAPTHFSSTAIQALAADPGGYLKAHLDDLLVAIVLALDPVLQRLLGLPAAQHVALASGAGVTIAVRTVTVEIQPSPFAVHLSGSVSGLPVVGSVELSLSADDEGLSAWSVGAGPAAIDIDGPILRPVVRAGYEHGDGWDIDLGLGLDDHAPGVDGHAELLARWREADAEVSVLVTTQVAADLTEDFSEGALATAAIGAVLDLVGGWVLGVDEVKAQLAVSVGNSTVGELLGGSILDPAAPANAPRPLPGMLHGWPGKLLTVASNLASAAPGVTVGPFDLGIANTLGVLGVSLTTADAAGIDLTSGGETSLHLEVDASWIDPPSGPPPAPGIVLDLLRVSGAVISPAPGIAVNGVGLRLGKTTGPLIDSGLRLETVAVHLFGSVVMDSTQQPEFAGGIEVELGGLGVPLGGGGGDNAVAKGIVSDAGGSGAPPRPSFSPAIAVQDHGAGIGVSLRAGSGDGPWFMPIQRAFGPVYLEQIGLGVTYRQGLTPKQLEMISLYLDGSVSLFGLSASVEKLRLGYHVSRPLFDSSSWEVDVEGFAISSSVGGLTLAGGLLKFDLAPPLSGVEYLGMLKVGYGSYGIALFGGYAHPITPSGSEFASFFAFGVLHAPIGGVPAFFITGIGIGFGINRDLAPPDINTMNQNPFMVALRASGPTPDPMVQLKDLRSKVGPKQGEYWVAAGISFTSFVLINGEILVTVQFGDGLDIAILGLARVQLPTADAALVSIELALLARFSSKEGLILVQAQLTDNSWLLERSVHLTGGFAFETWWKGPNAGQVVVTIGGYHPRFHHDGYPVVPRVGLSWSPIENISISGGVYFALCSEALMAGVGLEVAAHFGPAHARLAFGGDAIVFFDPFWFSVSAYAEVDVGIRIWVLFGTIDVELSFGVSVEVTGPPVFVTGHFSVCGFSVPFEFGDQADPIDAALDALAFALKYLRGDSDAQVTQASVSKGALVAGKSSAPDSGGVAKPPDGSADRPFKVAPEFQLTFVSTAPTQHVVLVGPTTKSQPAPSPGLGVAPMYSATLDSTLTVTLTSADVPAQVFTIDTVGLSARPATSFPKGIWGPAQNPAAPTVPKGDMIPASDGLTLDTLIPDSLFVGAAPVDYHQIELPIAGRKPLPFVTNRGNTDQRVTDALALKSAAVILSAGHPTTSERFSRAALMLAAGGTGLTSVAELRGARAAAPTFGSLADDLADSPDSVSTSVTSTVVDREPVPAQRFAPIVKALLGAPLSLAVTPAARTTVADRGKALSRITPTLASVRTANASRTQANLTLVPRSATTAKTVGAVGLAPLTRLASAPVGAVANARPVPAAAQRLAGMADQLLADPSPGPTTNLRSGQAGGSVLHEGELAVITVASRPSGDGQDMLVVSGGSTRVLCLAAGGRALDDRVVGDDGATAKVALPPVTERVVVVAVGASAGAGGSVAGWCGGQSLPSVGWGAALAGGAVVTAQAARVPGTRERADGGWVRTDLLAKAAQVVTVFTDPVDVVAIVVDDDLGGDAAAKISMRLLDATRALDAAGEPRPPEVVVDGVRSVLLYAVVTTGPEPGVLVSGCGGGQLAGVLGGDAGVAALAALLAVTGVEAAVRQPLVGGPGQRTVTVSLADGPVAKHVPRTVAKARRRPAPPAQKATAKKATAKKATAKKATAKKATAKKATAKKTTAKTTAKKATAKKTTAKKATAKKATARKTTAKKAAKKATARKTTGRTRRTTS